MRADLYTAPVFFVLGAAMLHGGWTMDRLAIRQIHPASFPGLVPCLLGGALMLAAVILFVQARGLRRSGGGATADETPPGGNRRLLAALSICLVYALVLVGQVPFQVATAIFIAVFVITFEHVLADEPAPLVRTLVAAAILGVVISAAVSLLFRYAFLVRLP
ncbi:MAG: tripartite tricarboxylate transporter TctB family protein [Geminicoccaceae bacterium]